MLLVVLAAGCVGSTAQTGSQTEQPAETWADATLTNALTGETFAISDYRGQIVLLEAMAVWCPVCAEQQAEIERAHALAPGEFVSISVDVDNTETAEKLSSYVAGKGFDWAFATDAGGFGSSLERQFGFQVLSVPSAPIILIDREGNARLLPGGVKNADALVAYVRSS